MIVGRKLQVLAELGPRRWRPKDLSDVWMILRRSSAPSRVLGEAIERAFAGHDHPGIDDLLGRAFWTEPHADVRWNRFARQLRRGVVPARPAVLVEDLRAALRHLRIGFSPGSMRPRPAAMPQVERSS
jgi:hypothetical protein